MRKINMSNANQSLFLILTIFLFVLSSYSQTTFPDNKGYIYVHLKTLDEVSSPDVTFNGTGGISTFSLNDNPTQIDIKDLGSSQNGRLWVVSVSGALYFRNLGSSSWTSTSVTSGVNAVDGGANGSCYYTTTTGLVRFFDGTTVTNLSTSILNYGGNSTFDIASTWEGEPYITTVGGKIYRYSGSGTVWNQVGITANNVKIDGNPVTKNIIVSRSDNSVWSIANDGSETNLGAPLNTSIISDVAVDSNGGIFVDCSVINSGTENPYYVYKWNSNTTWSTLEEQSINFKIITGGLGGSLWSIPMIPTSGTFLQSNIFTRVSSGSKVIWLDDERVRTSPSNGNSYMIAVVPGNYTLSEVIPSGWDLQNIGIFDPTNNSTVNNANGSCVFNVSAGESVHAVFENGFVNSFPMTSDCAASYNEDFGTGLPGAFGTLSKGQTSYHTIEKTTNISDGFYSVVNKIAAGWANFGTASILNDHSANDGRGMMYAVNASYAFDAFFKKRITGLIPGVTYSFSAWIVNVTPLSPSNPIVDFKIVNPIDHSTLSELSTNEITSSTWKKYELKFIATTTSVDIVLQNNTIGGIGNNLAIDDVSLALAPLPAMNVSVVHENSLLKGSIAVTSPLGGVYEYSLDNINFQLSPNFQNLVHSDYTVYYRYIGTQNCVASKMTTVRLLTSDLKVEKVVNYVTPYVGEIVEFTITATNLGPDDATGIVINDLVPSGYTLISANPNKGTWLAPNWTLGNLSNQANSKIVIKATVNASGEYKNVATISGLESDQDLTNDSAYSITFPIHEIVANSDTNTVPINGTNGGDSGINIFTNDNLNRLSFSATDVVLTSVPKAPLKVNSDGSVKIASNTKAGIYTIDYTICEALYLSNCATATVTVRVIPAPIVAVLDTTANPVNGIIGGDTGISVLTNDTLNGIILKPTDVVLSSVPTGPLTINSAGSVIIAPKTVAGTYTIDYTICEVLNPTNCSTASGSVRVIPAPIIAVPDTNANPVNGIIGGTTGINVLSNDTLNGIVVKPTDVVLTSVPKGPLTINSAGIVNISPNTVAATYTIDYTICEVLNPSNCSIASVTVRVTPAAIIAVPDTNANPVNGIIGGATGIIVFSNDTLNGIAVKPTDVVLTSVPKAPLTINSAGSVIISPKTVAGTYTIDYTICEVLNPTNCSTASASVRVTPAAIIAVTDTNTNPVNGIIGGATGINVLSNDTLNGIAVKPSDVVLTSVPKAPLTINADGTVSLSPKTVAGTYTVDYTICEVLNPSNCSTASVTVRVTPAAIIAVPDTNANPVNGIIGGATGINVFSNDTLNGIAVKPTDVVLTSVPKGPLTINSAGSVIISPKTVDGTYTIDYMICEVLNPTNCATASASVRVIPAPIVAVPDTNANPVNGIIGGTTGINVLSNDTLNGVAVKPTDVVLTAVPKGPLTVNSAGIVNISPNTVAGTYTIDYMICEVLNPSNCATASVTVRVTPVVIIAVPDTNANPVNGIIGGTTGINVLSNDTLNGIAVKPTDVALTSVPKGPLTINSAGSVIIAPKTVSGTYTIDYMICEVLNPSNCATASAIVRVTPAAIIAVPDTNTNPVNGVIGGAIGINVLTNDTLNGIAVKPTDVVLTSVPRGPLSISSTGIVSLLPNTAIGIYTIDYMICEVLNPSNCATSSVSVSVEFIQLPSIALIKTAELIDTNKDGSVDIGDEIKYTFKITNTGNVPLTKIYIEDLLPRLRLIGNPISLLPGESDLITFSATYSITVDDLLRGSVTNQAKVYGTSPLGIIVEDLSDNSGNTGNDGTVLGIEGCVVKVFNTITPNDDNENDFLTIEGLDCYTDNSIEIYNRWGVIVYSAMGYNNNDVVFNGYSNGRNSIKPNDGLPSGVYFYILKYKDHNGNELNKSGYIYLER